MVENSIVTTSVALIRKLRLVKISLAITKSVVEKAHSSPASPHFPAANRYRTASPPNGAVKDCSPEDAVTEPVVATKLVAGLNHSNWYLPEDNCKVNGFS